MTNGSSSSKNFNDDYGLAHDDSPYLTPSEKHPSKLNQRLWGLSHRIWIIIALIAFIILFSFLLPSDTHFLYTPFSFRSSSSTTENDFDTSSLRAVNYMNATDEPNPFPFCPTHGPGDEIGAKYGLHTMKKTVLHLGSGASVQRVIHKALLGLPVTISVLGGSGAFSKHGLLPHCSPKLFRCFDDAVSACHGSGDDPISPKCYPSRFFRWWNSVFPNAATELTNGAIRRTNSAYLGYCHKHHLPDVTDLVILELDVDDKKYAFF